MSDFHIITLLLTGNPLCLKKTVFCAGTVLRSIQPAFPKMSYSKTRLKRITRAPTLLFVVAATTALILPLLPFNYGVLSLSSRFDRAFESFGTAPSSHPPPLTNLPSRNGWSFSETESFCKSIIRSPLPFDESCEMNTTTKLCRDGSSRMFSQYSQDYYVYTRFFSKMNRRGIYVDVAANHPWKISNSFFFDACLGWDGICVEANPDYTELLEKNRDCKVVANCLSNQEGHNVSFVLNRAFSGISITNKFIDGWRAKGQNYSEVHMSCTTMENMLAESQVVEVDYLSLDVEGHELMILQGINWDTVRINVLSVEVSGRTKAAIDNFILPKGYVRHIPNLDEKSKKSGVLVEDAVFVRKKFSIL